MNTKSISALKTIAEYYQRDSEDFLEKFLILRDQGLRRTARIKNFIDLAMGCECILKSHIALGRLQEDPKLVYSEIKSASHDIGKLANLANYMTNREYYDEIASALSNINVFNRYSLEAELTFFPNFRSHTLADVNYSNTIGNYPWVTKLTENLEILIKNSINEFNGEVTSDFSELMKNDSEVHAILRQNKRKNRS